MAVLDLPRMTVLVTGVAGFIGSFVAKRLIEERGMRVVGLDNCNDYYDPRLKEARLDMVCSAADAAGEGSFEFVKGDLCDDQLVADLLATHDVDVVVNLAAQAGVRYSIDHPRAYVDSNVVGFFNVLEACRSHEVKHLVFASSSSVYGQRAEVPFSEQAQCDAPVSLYAATKKSNELMAYSYAALFGIPCTGLRFFTVYGPMGRPDMAYFSFADKMVRGETIQLYNYGDMWRDFTYVDDIVTGVVDVMGRVPEADADGARYKIYNIGDSNPVTLQTFADTLERLLLEEGVIEQPVPRELLPMQPGDVYRTYADVSALERDFGFKPSIGLEEGLRSFVRWYKAYYGL